jgi:predicted small secreted protein
MKLLLILASLILSGCASTNTVLQIGVGYDVTDYVHDCERGFFGCGHKGTRETARIDILWAPSIRPGPYAGACHSSHYSTGKPFNNKFDADFSTELCGGGFFQFNDRH